MLGTGIFMTFVMIIDAIVIAAFGRPTLGSGRGGDIKRSDDHFRR